jgi:hypothetical protein
MDANTKQLRIDPETKMPCGVEVPQMARYIRKKWRHNHRKECLTCQKSIKTKAESIKANQIKVREELISKLPQSKPARGQISPPKMKQGDKEECKVIKCRILGKPSNLNVIDEQIVLGNRYLKILVNKVNRIVFSAKKDLLFNMRIERANEINEIVNKEKQAEGELDSIRAEIKKGRIEAHFDGVDFEENTELKIRKEEAIKKLRSCQEERQRIENTEKSLYCCEKHKEFAQKPQRPKLSDIKDKDERRKEKERRAEEDREAKRLKLVYKNSQTKNGRKDKNTKEEETKNLENSAGLFYSLESKELNGRKVDYLKVNLNHSKGCYFCAEELLKKKERNKLITKERKLAGPKREDGIPLESYNYIHAEKRAEESFKDSWKKPQTLKMNELEYNSGCVSFSPSYPPYLTSLYQGHRELTFTPIEFSHNDKKTEDKVMFAFRMRLKPSKPGKPPIFTEGVAISSMELPRDSIISRVELHRTARLKKRDDEYYIVITYRSGTKVKRPAPTRDFVALDLGWRVVNKGTDNETVMPGTLVTDSGEWAQIWLPQKIRDLKERIEEVQSYMDKDFDQIKKSLGLFLKSCQTLPLWLKEATQFSYTWKGREKIFSLIREWENSRFVEDAEIFDLMSRYKKNEIHHEQEISGLRKQFERGRKDYYRKIARGLSNTFRKMGLEHDKDAFMDLSKFNKSPDALNAPKDCGKSARYNRNLCAPSALRGMIDRTFGEDRLPSVDKNGTSTFCPVCHRRISDQTRKEEIQICSCGSFQRDYSSGVEMNRRCGFVISEKEVREKSKEPFVINNVQSLETWIKKVRGV